MTRRGRVRWAVAAAVVVLVLLGAGVAVALARSGRNPTAPVAGPTPSTATLAPTPSPTTPPGAGLTGPLNILLVGADTRVSEPDWQPHADAVLLLHVPAGLRRGYLYSLPRDLLVDVPSFRPAGFGGGQMKLTEAMSRGSRVPGRARPNPEQGFRLLSRTVAELIGIEHFDAGAVLTFTGFSRLVDAVGGVELTIERRVVSQHRRPDGRHRTPRAGGGGYVGPQMVYRPGRRTLVGWQALDFARQRYLSGGDYTRQRHQRQLIKALLRKAAATDLAADPDRLTDIVAALGETLVFTSADNDHGPVDFGYALRALTAESLTLVGLPGASVIRNGAYRGEQLRAAGRDFLEAVADGEVESHLADHPKLVHR